MGKGGGGGKALASKSLFLLPKGKGVSLSRSIVLNLESADKDEFVTYAGRLKKWAVNKTTSLSLKPLFDKSKQNLVTF